MKTLRNHIIAYFPRKNNRTIHKKAACFFVHITRFPEKTREAHPGDLIKRPKLNKISRNFADTY